MRSIYIETHERQYAYKKHETYKKWTGRAGLAHLDFSSIANTVWLVQIKNACGCSCLGWSRLRTPNFKLLQPFAARLVLSKV